MHRLTLVVYRPGSIDCSLGTLYDSLDSSLDIKEFTEFGLDAARDYLVRTFQEDHKLRQESWGPAGWIAPLQVIPLVDGRHLDNVSVDLAVDVTSMIRTAMEKANGAV